MLESQSAQLICSEPNVEFDEYFQTQVELNAPMACVSAFNQTVTPTLNSPLPNSLKILLRHIFGRVFVNLLLGDEANAFNIQPTAATSGLGHFGQRF